jgi:hypothetical protein
VGCNREKEGGTAIGHQYCDLVQSGQLGEGSLFESQCGEKGTFSSPHHSDQFRGLRATVRPAGSFTWVQRSRHEADH